MWDKITNSFGKVQAGTTLKAKFQYSGDKLIGSVEVTCGCTNAKYMSKTKTLSVDFTPKGVGKHLLQQDIDNYYNRKEIKVHYEDGSVESLFIDAQVYNKL